MCLQNAVKLVNNSSFIGREGYALLFFIELLRLIACIAILNLPSLFLHDYAGIDRGWISLESLLFIASAYIGYYVFAFIVIIIFSILESFNFAKASFENLNNINAFDAITLINQMPLENYIYLLLFFIFVFFQFFICMKLCKKTKKSKGIFLLLALTLPTFAEETLRQNSTDSDFIFFKKYPYESITSAYIKNEGNFDGFVLTNHENSNFEEIPYEKATRIIEGSHPKKLGLIIVESWGYPKNKDELWHQLDSLIKNKYLEIDEISDVTYTGTTAAAELRELCGINPLGVKILSIPLKFRDKCLPSKLKEDGYHVFSIHAGASNFYNRITWYPQIGLDNNLFFDETKKNIYGNCYSWQGFCDIKLMPEFIKQLISKEKSFVYWITLNSHMPYDERDIFFSNKYGCEKFFIEKKSKRCNNHIIIKDFFYSLNNALTEFKEDLSGAEIIIVGDHAPPFFEAESRKSFVDGKFVPAFHIKIK